MLRDFQQALAAGIVGENGALPPGLAGGASRQELGLKVYRNNSAHAHVSNLKDAYPVVTGLIGEEASIALALDMMRQNPCASACVRSWSDALPEFLSQTPLAPQYPYLADVAEIERAWLRAYHSADNVPQNPPLPADPERLAACRLSMASSTYICRSKFDAHAIWAARCAPEDSAEAPQAAACIIYRNQMQVVAEPLGTHAADCFEALDEPQAALEWLGTLDGQEDWQQLAGRLLAAGAIKVFEENENDCR